MKAIEFPEQNGSLSNNNPNYYNVPSFVAKDIKGTVIMKIQITPEELEKIKENDFTFWYSRETGNGGLQPFSMYVDYPFKKIEKLVNIDPDSLKGVLFVGCKIANNLLGADRVMIFVLDVSDEEVLYEVLDQYGKMINRHTTTYEILSARLKAIGEEYENEYIIVNPEDRK